MSHRIPEYRKSNCGRETLTNAFKKTLENINPSGCVCRTNALDTFYRNRYFSEFGKPCDMLLKTDDGVEFNVYSKFLSKRSEFFNTLFSIKEEAGQTTVIHGIKSGIFETILLYFYTGHTSFNIDNMMSLLVASDFLMMEHLLSETKKFVLKNVTIENCVTLYITAYRIKRLEMEEKCRRFLQLCFEKAVAHSWDEVFDLPFRSLRYFLGDASVNISGERFVWLFIEIWVLKDPSNRMPVVPELLRFLSINEIDDKLAGDIISSPIILENELYKDLGNLHETLPYLDDTAKAQTVIIFKNEIPFITGARLPRRLHFVTKSFAKINGGEMYISYDNHLDILRKLGVLTFRPLKLLRVENHIYIFEGHSLFRGVIGGSTYDLLENVRQPMPPLQSGVFDVSFVEQVFGHIYALKNDASEEEVGFYQYVRENNEWSKITPMHHHREIMVEEAVSLNGLIYAICKQMVDDSMVMQVYDPPSCKWRQASPPQVVRRRMAAVVFQEKIFLIGGEYDGMNEDLQTSKDVEVYDPVLDQWTFFPDLLFMYENVRTSVMDERLFVYDGQLTPMTCWDGSGEWKIVNDQSLSLKTHCFCTVEGEDVVREVMRENKEVDATDWLESGRENQIFSRSSV